MVVLRAKLLLTGDSCVGKTALTQVFHSDGTHYPKNYSMVVKALKGLCHGTAHASSNHSTIGAEVLVKSVNIPETSDSVELYIYDSAGKEMFAETVQQYWQHPNLIIVAYDVTNEQSFNACSKWLERCRALKPDQNLPGALVATKSDLKQRRVISTKQGRDFANTKNLEYFECSAKEHENVEAVFYFLAKEFHRLYKEKLDTMKTLT